jgi:hypothetical protein
MRLAKPFLLLALSVASVGLACGREPASPSDAGAIPADAAPGAADAGAGERFAETAAEAICGALFRCCDQADLVDYFAPYRASERLAAFADRLPPTATLDEPACRAVLPEMLVIAPFGDWLHEVEAGRVGFDDAAFQACVGELAAAACGAPLRAALHDGTCLGFAAPAGGSEQRRMFTRTALPGTACGPIRDGVGAAFYGTCDPTQAFCCYADAAHTQAGCTFPFDGDGVARAGVCAAAGGPGASCSPAPPLALCRTGADCDDATGLCVDAGAAPLALGATCATDGFQLLGECVDGWCDLLGSRTCEARRPDGHACDFAEACEGGACLDGVCATAAGCSGAVPGDPDAGPGAPPDAAPPGPDAGAATGETCASAIALAAASAPAGTPGYDHVVTGAFGATNDYNPYDGAQPALPPSCSIVYDAPGAEVVYRLVLDPGDSLELRYTVTPSTIPAAVYLLDQCAPVVDWPDYDHSGMCGNNEYAAQGFCGAIGCDPLVWSFTHPETLDGVPTAPQTFYLVLDHQGAAPPSSYQLEWRVLK